MKGMRYAEKSSTARFSRCSAARFPIPSSNSWIFVLCRFSIKRISCASASVRFRTVAGIVLLPANFDARKRRAPATSSYTPFAPSCDGRTRIACKTPCNWMLAALCCARRFVPAALNYRVVGGGSRTAGHIIFRVNKAISSNPGLYAIRSFEGVYLNYR